MKLLISIVCSLMTLKATGIDAVDIKLYESKWKALMNRTGYWPKELELMVKHFSQSTTNENSGRFDNLSTLDHSVAPFLLPIFVIPTNNVYVGSMVSDRTILTSCSSTTVPMDDGTVQYVKAEQILVILSITFDDKVTPVVTGVMDVRRHPTCEQPYRDGTWRNDLAVLILPIAVIFKPKVLEPIELPSLDFYGIYSAIKQKVWSNSTCYAAFMKYQGDSLPRIKTFLPVRIQKYSGCPRRCGYMIDQCTQELGGYSITHLSNATEINLQDAAHGAAIMCDGRIYGVLRPDSTCGFGSFGHLPKPEAMLYMYVNFADPSIKPKPIVGSSGSDQNGSNVIVNSLMLSWVIAFTIKSIA